MISMWKGEVYCPRYSELRPQPCPRPPTRAALVEEVNNVIRKRWGNSNRTLVVTPQRMPDLRWLLDTLSVLEPNHYIF